EFRMIQFNNVSKWYGQYQALCDVTAKVSQGEVLVVCGPSGSGKSTLIRTVNRLEPIQAGSIVVDEQDVHACKSIDELRSHIGFVFQQFSVLPDKSVRSNLSMAPVILQRSNQAAAREEVMSLLEGVGLGHTADGFSGQLSG